MKSTYQFWTDVNADELYVAHGRGVFLAEDYFGEGGEWFSQDAEDAPVLIEVGTFTQADYEARPGFSQSDAKLILGSPARFYYQQTHRRASSKAMELGSLIDALLFEQPHSFAPKTLNWSTKPGMAEKARFELEGLTPVSPDEWDNAHAVAQRVREHPDAGPLIVGGRFQVALYGRDEATGVATKGLLDCLQPGVIIDEKKAADASAWAFARQAGNLGYAIQAAAYLDLAEQSDLGVTEFKHVVYELEPPHRIAVYRLDDDSLAYGWQQWRRALDLYARCVETDTWPDFPTDQGELLRLPEYLLKKTVTTAYTEDLPEFDWNTLT